MMISHQFHKTHGGQDWRRWQLFCAIIGLLLIAGLAVGCGGGSDSDGGDSGSSSQSASEGSAAMQPLQACELLTKTDVEAILGSAVDEPQQSAQEDAERQFWLAMCNYYAPEPGHGAGLTVQSSSSPDPAQALDAYVASLKKSLGDAYEGQTIDGIGGAAVWDGALGQLTAFVEDYMLIATVTGAGLDESAKLEAAKAVVEKALSKLPR